MRDAKKVEMRSLLINSDRRDERKRDIERKTGEKREKRREGRRRIEEDLVTTEGGREMIHKIIPANLLQPKKNQAQTEEAYLQRRYLTRLHFV